MSGEYYRLLEQRKDLINFIKELEYKRLNTDVLNVNKYNNLYEVLNKINNKLKQLGSD